MILSNLTSPENSNVTILTTDTVGTLTASLIQTKNTITNTEQIYMAIEDGAFWDRVMLYGGELEFNYIVGSEISFQSILSCSIQTTNLSSSPQQLKNKSFEFTYSYTGPQGLKLQWTSLDEFDRIYTIPLPFGGYTPFPFMDTNGIIDVAAFYIEENQQYKIFIRSGEFTLISASENFYNVVYLKFNGILFELYDGSDVWFSADGSTWAPIDVTQPTVILSGLPPLIYDIPKQITINFSEVIVGLAISDISSNGCTT